jgi:hypothetical protein
MTVGFERARSTARRVPAQTRACSASDFEVVCLFAVAGLVVTALVFGLIGFDELGRILTMAG